MIRIVPIGNAFLLAFVVCACSVHTERHDPVRAAYDTNDFLRALYVDGEYDKALAFGNSRLRQSLIHDDLKRLAEGIEQQ
jgi:hypothetical protein